MKAARIHSYGGVDAIVIDEIAKPNFGPDQVLVSVCAAGVNPVDWKIAEGYGKEWFGHTLPITLGEDMAGVVEAVGDEVFGYVNLARLGAFAEHVMATPTEI